MEAGVARIDSVRRLPPSRAEHYAVIPIGKVTAPPRWAGHRTEGLLHPVRWGQVVQTNDRHRLVGAAGVELHVATEPIEGCVGLHYRASGSRRPDPVFPAPAFWASVAPGSRL